MENGTLVKLMIEWNVVDGVKFVVNEKRITYFALQFWMQPVKQVLHLHKCIELYGMKFFAFVASDQIQVASAGKYYAVLLKPLDLHVFFQWNWSVAFY